MTFAKRLYVYLLNDVYKGNKSQLARDLGMDVSNLRKAQHRLLSGRRCSSLLEDMIELCIIKDYDIEVVKSQHRMHIAVHLVADRPCPYKKVMDGLKIRLRGAYGEISHIPDLVRLLKAAEELMRQIRAICCGEEESSSHACLRYWSDPKHPMSDADDCPCERFNEFINWLDRYIRRFATM